MGQFKEFFTERRSIANAVAEEIYRELQNTPRLSRASVYDVTSRLMQDYDGDRLGSGAFANVYGGQNGGYVVKIAINDNVARSFFSNMHKYENPLFPKIEKHLILEHSDELVVDIYVLERLKVDFDGDESANMQFLKKVSEATGANYNCFTLIDVVGLLKKGVLSEDKIAAFDNVMRQYGRTVEQLIDFVATIRKTTNAISLDVHCENFGFNTEGGLVIFDPVSF